MDDEKFQAVLSDLPEGMRTWIWNNASEVAAALFCLMNDQSMFRMCSAIGMLQHMQTANKSKAIETQEGEDDW